MNRQACSYLEEVNKLGKESIKKLRTQVRKGFKAKNKYFKIKGRPKSFDCKPRTAEKSRVPWRRKNRALDFSLP